MSRFFFVFRIDHAIYLFVLFCVFNGVNFRLSVNKSLSIIIYSESTTSTMVDRIIYTGDFPHVLGHLFDNLTEESKM